MNNTQKQADHLLLEHWDGSLPVNPVYIANALGITVLKSTEQTEPVQTQFTQGRYEITIQEQAPKTQHRFYIAHAIGHIVLNHLSEKRPQILDNKLSFQSHAPSEEMNANEFALALLIPERLVSTWFKKMIRTDLAEAAAMFDVAEAALYQRLIQLHFINP